MEETLLERLDILVTSGQVEDSVRRHVISTVRGFAEERDVELREDNAGSFVTHFAIACTRIARGEAVTDAPDSIKALAEQYPDLVEVAQAMFPEPLNKVTDAEVGFLNMYLCLLLGRE